MLDIPHRNDDAATPAQVFRARAASLLGPHFRQRLAGSLSCTAERFSRRMDPQPTIVAVLELLELLAARGVPNGSLPERWREGAEVDRVECAVADLRSRFETALGARAPERLSTGLRLTLRTVTGRLGGAVQNVRPGVLAEMAALVELLEIALATGPAEGLPARWRVELPPAAPPRRYAQGQEIADRARLVLGPAAVVRLAHATGRSQRYLESLLTDEHAGSAKVQPHLVAIVELLEVLDAEGVPRERWPARWRSVGEGV